MYECHVTVEKPLEIEILHLLENIGQEYAWKTSKIEGDPVLGVRTFFYFTAHSSEFDRLKAKMDNLADLLGDRVIRKKIEHIVYDTKTGIGI